MTDLMQDNKVIDREVLIGRVSNIYENNIIVALDNGDVGRILNCAADSGLGIGATIKVAVVQSDDSGIVLELVDSSDNVLRESIEANKYSWDNWTSMPESHKKTMTALLALKKFVAKYHSDLESAHKEFDYAKKHSQEIFESTQKDIQKQYEAEISKYDRECKANIDQTRSRISKATVIVAACQTFTANLPDIQSVRDAANAALENVIAAQDKVNKAIEEKCNAYKKVFSIQTADFERNRNSAIDLAKMAHQERDTNAEQRYQSRRKITSEKYFTDISTGFSSKMIKSFCQNIQAQKINALKYECPKTLPEFIVLGDAGITIENSSTDDLTTIQTLETQTHEISQSNNKSYTVKLPYSQRLQDGISLLIRYAPSSRSYAQSQIQPLLLKLFMSFPAGKLEATMIDPLELGASFSDMPKLSSNPNSLRIIDTKIWSKEKDIEAAIATLRQRLENAQQAYGDDQESRLKKEAVRALAITDFPVGFSDTALKDLRAIIRNSASLGICIIICANDAELEKLSQRNDDLVAEIKQNIVDTKVDNNRLVFMNEKYQGLFLELDDMSDVIKNKDNILSIISSTIDRTPSDPEPLSGMFPFDIYDSNNWFTGNHDEIAIPIGIKGASTVVNMVLGRGGGNTEHHALIAGQTGAGKSTLLHTLIMSAMINYSPDELQMYLLDFKEGVEFSAYTHFRLPSLRVVAINSEREFGLTVLKELCTELETRTKHFIRYGVSDILGYNQLIDVPKVPKLLLIFDEVQELFRSKGESDSISAECLSCINKLVLQGRALGIHLIFACQDFRNCSGIEAYYSNFAIRIAVKGSAEGATSVLNSDNKGIVTLQNQPVGSAIYNGGCGVESANNFFQIAYMSEQDRTNLLSRFDAYYSDGAIAPLYEKTQTRILLTNAEDNIHNPINQLILKGQESVTALATSKDGYGLMLGQGFGKKSVFIPELTTHDRENLLIVTKEEKMALSLFELSAMSILYEELHTKADKSNALIYIVDLSAEELQEEDCDFNYFKSQFNSQIEVVKMNEVDDLIASLHEMLLNRAEGRVPCSERIFLLFFGLNRARRLLSGKMYEDNDNEESTVDMLKKILAKGPKLGINSIIWSENLKGVENVLGDRYDSVFDKRIAYGLDDDSMDNLVSETESKNLKGSTAVYMNISNDVRNTHFRPYDIPAKVWVSRYAEVYESIVEQDENSL